MQKHEDNRSTTITISVALSAQVTLVIMKACGVIAWSWLAVLSPILVCLVLWASINGLAWAFHKYILRLDDSLQPDDKETRIRKIHERLDEVNEARDRIRRKANIH